MRIGAESSLCKGLCPWEALHPQRLGPVAETSLRTQIWDAYVVFLPKILPSKFLLSTDAVCVECSCIGS